MNTKKHEIKTEILKAGRNDVIARQILKAVLEKIPSPLSWEDVSKDIEIKSPKTVSAYIHLLRSIFALIILYHADISDKTIKFLFYHSNSIVNVLEIKNKQLEIHSPFVKKTLSNYNELLVLNK